MTVKYRALYDGPGAISGFVYQFTEIFQLPQELVSTAEFFNPFDAAFNLLGKKGTLLSVKDFLDEKKIEVETSVNILIKEFSLASCSSLLHRKLSQVSFKVSQDLEKTPSELKQ